MNFKRQALDITHAIQLEDADEDDRAYQTALDAEDDDWDYEYWDDYDSMSYEYLDDYADDQDFPPDFDCTSLLLDRGGY